MDRLASIGHVDKAPEQQLTKVSCVVLFHYNFRQCLCCVTHLLFCDTLLSADPAVTDPPSFYQGNSSSPLFLHTFYCKKEEANTELQRMLSQHGNQPNSILAA